MSHLNVGAGNLTGILQNKQEVFLIMEPSLQVYFSILNVKIITHSGSNTIHTLTE